MRRNSTRPPERLVVDTPMLGSKLQERFWFLEGYKKARSVSQDCSGFFLFLAREYLSPTKSEDFILAVIHDVHPPGG
jgi:hypothetical protein